MKNEAALLIPTQPSGKSRAHAMRAMDSATSLPTPSPKVYPAGNGQFMAVTYTGGDYDFYASDAQGNPTRSGAHVHVPAKGAQGFINALGQHSETIHGHLQTASDGTRQHYRATHFIGTQPTMPA